MDKKVVYAACINAKGNNLQIAYIEHIEGLKFKVIKAENHTKANVKALASSLNNAAKSCDLKPLNFQIYNGTVKSIGYALDNLDGGKSNIVLGTIVNGADASTVGYVVFCPANKKIVNIRVSEAINYRNKFEKKGIKFLQNMMYVDASEDKQAHFRSFKDGVIPVIELKNEKAPQAARYVAGTTDNKSVFTKEQLAVLSEGKRKGVNIKHFANPKIPAENMKELLKIELAKFNSSYLADPKFSLDTLKFYRVAITNKINIKGFAYKDKATGKVTLAHQFSVPQMNEISLGIISGINYRKYMKPSMKPNDMAEVRIRLEQNLWSGKKLFDVK